MIATLRNQFGGHSTEAAGSERRPAESGTEEAMEAGEAKVKPSGQEGAS